jgi:ArsR family transcriptional regulator, lead/cadmium/zinc/bismuth-responsive transcriptional repressor
MKGETVMTDSETRCQCEVIHEDIVNDVQKKMPDKDEYIELASLFKMFGDGTRVQILHALELHEMCVCDLASLLGITKSAVSHQLKALKLSNLVKFRREGQVVFYSLADDHVKTLIDMGFEHIREE